VLVTGGDPMVLPDKELDRILGKLSEIKRIERIRIGTRMFVTMPMRFNDKLLAILEKYHKPGTREVTMMTHFEHTAEITPDVLDAVTRVRKLGISIYNQQVFTYFNSRRFETCYLRKKLKLIGIDPYYTFNTKGKEETSDFRVPIARIEQEMKEEARLLPGIVRTDEPVFNVPRLGKSHLRAWQDHEPIMVNAKGQRIYRFYPWESNMANMKTYIYTDVSIYNYMIRLMGEKEKMNDYATIWSYF
jgi:lysine 2,3-aminomutase